MDFRRTRWVDGAVTAAAVLTAIQLCDAASMPVSRSIVAGLLFASSFFGIQRIYSAIVDILIIVSKPRSPGDNRVA